MEMEIDMKNGDLIAPIVIGVGVAALEGVIAWRASAGKPSLANAPSHEPLKAEVSESGLDTLGYPMYFKVTNNDSFDWTNCIVLANLVPGTGDVPYRNLKPEADIIRHGQTATLRIMDFEAGVNGGGQALDPRGVFNMAIKCD